MKDDLTPYLAMAITFAIGLGFAIWADHSTRPTFDQRWSGVELIEGGVKGDRIIHKPIRKAPAWLERGLLFRTIPVHDVAAGAECDWRFCVIT